MRKIKFFFIDKVEMPNTWNAIWNRLGIMEGDLECLYNGEVWQYMGSKVEDCKFVHTFRHRCHPKSNEREYRHIGIPIS